MPPQWKAKKKATWVGGSERTGVLDYFFIFLICLFVIVIQATGCVVALGVATYGYVAMIFIAVTVPAWRPAAFFFTECPQPGKNCDVVRNKTGDGMSDGRLMPTGKPGRPDRL